MTSAPFDPRHRPDQARFARTTVGMASPLWFPFLMAASAGAAWWSYANWARVGVQPRRGEGEGASEPAAAPDPVTPPVAASSALAESLGVQSAAEEPDTSADEEVSELIDAAYAANLGPVPTPPAKKRAAGKQSAARKTTAKKTAAKKTTPTKAPAKTPAKKTAAKKTAAKAPAKKRGS